MTTEYEQAAIQAWVEQLRTDGYATTTVGRLCDEPVAVKRVVMLAEPVAYYARVRAERDAEYTRDGAW